MKYLLVFLLTLSFTTSCKNKNSASDLKEIPLNMVEKILGSFVGQFGDNKITLVITKAYNGEVAGRSIVGGNDRPFSGTMTKLDEGYNIVAKEPGDDPNDGIFTITMETSNIDVVKGSWVPYDNSKPSKKYTLQRKAFAYRTDVGEYPEASQRELLVEDVENLIKPDLEFMRNEIFARHGYCFNKKHLRELFEEEDWYVPNNTDVRDKLTEIEKKNIALIKRYEKYAEEYGDEYGR